MADKDVHVVGTGAVALALGYLLTERGHRVLHTSLRDIRLAQIPVAVQTGEGVSRGTYTPRYRSDAGPAWVPRVNLFAVHGAQLAMAVRQAGPSIAAPACNLVFCSDPDPAAHAWTLVYPLLSAEHCGERGLQVITSRQVEICLGPAAVAGEREKLVALFDDLGLAVAASVSSRRFRARHLQTAAVYVALLAVRLGIIDAAKVEAALLRAIREELLAMATARDPAFAADVPPVDPSHDRLLAASIAAGARHGVDNLLASSLLYLMEEGRRKLVAHLAPIAPAWNEYTSTRALDTQARQLIASVLA